jgi:hypothetical protein
MNAGGFATLNGQIQYGSARLLTSRATPPRRRGLRLADPRRSKAEATRSLPVSVLFAGLLLLAGLLAALLRGVPGIVVTTVFGGT